MNLSKLYICFYFLSSLEDNILLSMKWQETSWSTIMIDLIILSIVYIVIIEKAKKISFFMIKEKIRWGTLQLISHIHLAHHRIIECVPFSIDWILAICSIMTEIEVSRVVDYTGKLVNWIFDWMMMVISNDFRKIQILGHFNSIIYFRLR